MSQLELESLLSYEHHLATCYQAEYLLEMSMSREHISEETRWPAYQDSGELQAAAGASLTYLHNGGEDMETETLATSGPDSVSHPLSRSLANSGSRHSTEMISLAHPGSGDSSLSNGCPLSGLGERVRPESCQPLLDGEPARKKLCLRRPEL